MTIPITDIFGAELMEGDTIAVAFAERNSAHQRVGKILGFSEKANISQMIDAGAPPTIPVLIVEWDQNHGRYLPTKPSKIESFEGRIIKLGDNL